MLRQTQHGAPENHLTLSLSKGEEYRRSYLVGIGFSPR